MGVDGRHGKARLAVLAHGMPTTSVGMAPNALPNVSREPRRPSGLRPVEAASLRARVGPLAP